MQKNSPGGEPNVPTFEADEKFQEHKREFYRLQYEFFKRAPEPSGECLDAATCGQPGGQYTDNEGVVHYIGGGPLCSNCREWAGWEVRGKCYQRLAENPDDDTSVKPDDPDNIREFSIRVNVRSTMEQIDEEIRRQVDTIKRQLLDEKVGRLILRDWLRAKAGKRLPTGKKDTFTYWLRCLEAYDKRSAGDTWESIGIEICKVDSHKPKGTITREARNHFDNAKRLIVSAVRGTFPN